METEEFARYFGLHVTLAGRENALAELMDTADQFYNNGNFQRDIFPLLHGGHGTGKTVLTQAFAYLTSYNEPRSIAVYLDLRNPVNLTEIIRFVALAHGLSRLPRFQTPLEGLEQFSKRGTCLVPEQGLTLHQLVFGGRYPFDFHPG